jgi:3-dehydroquinate synthase
MKTISQEFSVAFQYNTFFTEGLFQIENPLFRDFISQDGTMGKRKLLFVIDSGVHEAHPDLQKQIVEYCFNYSDVLDLRTVPILVPGGEASKNDYSLIEYLLTEIDELGICRHSYLVGIGGGAVLDMVGFAAAIAHRGVRHIRIPTTVLSQNDSGIGVKNSVNYFNKKNFLGTFKPPQAVMNDVSFLDTLHPRDWRAGISEAIKVALIKDEPFFREIQANVELYNQRDIPAMESLIYHCAQLHLDHISGGDPFEMGSARPLDFGHWAAHKLEQLTKYRLRHGEAVAIGIALDVTYSHLIGRISQAECLEVISLIENLGFRLYVPELSQNLEEWQNPACVLTGLQEFREHLGGELCITLIDKIGQGVEVHEMDYPIIIRSIEMLKAQHEALIALEE